MSNSLRCQEFRLNYHPKRGRGGRMQASLGKMSGPLEQMGRRYDSLRSFVWVWCPFLVSPVMSQSFLLDETPREGFMIITFLLEDVSLGRQQFRESLPLHLLFLKIINMPSIICGMFCYPQSHTDHLPPPAPEEEPETESCLWATWLPFRHCCRDQTWAFSERWVGLS